MNCPHIALTGLGPGKDCQQFYVKVFTFTLEYQLYQYQIFFKKKNQTIAMY